MGDDDGAELLWEEPVGKSPDKACYESCHNQHEVELGKVYQAVDQSCYDKADIWIPALRETVLYETVMVDTGHYTLVKIHKMYTIMNEP